MYTKDNNPKSISRNVAYSLSICLLLSSCTSDNSTTPSAPNQPQDNVVAEPVVPEMQMPTIEYNEQITVEEFVQTNDIVHNFDFISVDEESITLQGWAILHETNTNNQTMALLLTEEDGNTFVYEMTSQIREDVGLHFENEMYNLSGFSCVLNPQEHNLRNAQVQIVIQDEGYYYLDLNSQALEENIEVSPVVVWDDTWTMVESSDILFNLDLNNLEGDILHLKGWGVLPDQSIEQQQIFIKTSFESEEQILLRTEKQERYDVSDHFGNELYSHTGFELQVNLAEIPVNTHHLQLVVEQDGVYYVSDVLNLEW